MAIPRILDDLLGQHSKVAVLRVLSREEELVGRAIARRTGLSPRTAHEALGELTRQNIVIMNVVGTAHVFSLNRKRYIVKDMLSPLFEQERNLIPTMAKELRRLISGNRVVSMAVFGSLARGESKPQSDLDLFVLVRNGANAKPVGRLLEETRNGFTDRFGMFLSPYVVSIGDFAKRLKRKDKLIRSILREGWVVWGKPLAEVLVDESKKRRH